MGKSARWLTASSECLREVVRAVQRVCGHVVCGCVSVVFLRRGVRRFRTGRVTAELSCELSGARYGT